MVAVVEGGEQGVQGVQGGEDAVAGHNVGRVPRAPGLGIRVAVCGTRPP
jgi:hypothetical protein